MKEPKDHKASFLASYLKLVRNLSNFIHWREEQSVIPFNLINITEEKWRWNYAIIILKRIMVLKWFETQGIFLPQYFLQNFLHEYNNLKEVGQESELNFFQDALCAIWFNLDSRFITTFQEKYFSRFSIYDKLAGLSLFSMQSNYEIFEDQLIYPKIIIDDSVWGEIEAIFNQYKWDIDEMNTNSQNFITPAILETIHEKEGVQSESGRYYTPIELTQYMVSLTIPKYLTLKGNKVLRTQYEDIIIDLLDNQSPSPSEIDQIQTFYQDLLKTVTICDNSCGGGVFLSQITRELIKFYTKCIDKIKENPDFESERIEIEASPSERFYILSNIFSRNIFGVDLQNKSVELTRIRLELMLIASIPANMELANLRPYIFDLSTQIQTGNSLIGYVSPPSPSQNTLDQLLSGPNLRNKGSLKEDLDNQFQKQYHIIKIDEDSHPFHWYLAFPSVFNHNGFDLVIGNPPYLSFSSSKVNKTQSQKRVIEQIYGPLEDLYEAFVLHSHSICKGICCLVIPTSFYRQVGQKMATHLLLFENLGENIFRGVNASFCIVQFDREIHQSFQFRNYLHLENKISLLGSVTPQEITSFEFYQEDPILQYLETHCQRFRDFQLLVQRGEEYGRKTTQAHNSTNSKQVPIFTADDLSPFLLQSPHYYVDISQIKKNFYSFERIGVNLAFRHYYRASYLGQVFTLKSIISIYHTSREILLELLGYFNSSLFNWYHQLKFGFYSEIRANIITEMRNTYPIRISQSPELLKIVQYAFFTRNRFIQRTINNLIYEEYLIDQFYNDQLYSTRDLILHHLISLHLISVDFDSWLELYMKKIMQMNLSPEENMQLETLEEKNHHSIQDFCNGCQQDSQLMDQFGLIENHPWVCRIEQYPKQ